MCACVFIALAPQARLWSSGKLLQSDGERVPSIPLISIGKVRGKPLPAVLTSSMRRQAVKKRAPSTATKVPMIFVVSSSPARRCSTSMCRGIRAAWCRPVHPPATYHRESNAASKERCEESSCSHLNKGGNDDSISSGIIGAWTTQFLRASKKWEIARK